MLKHLLSLFLIALVIKDVYSLEKPKTLDVVCTIFDHHPDKNKNFEPPYGSLTKGWVEKKLGSDRIPTIDYDVPNINSKLADARILEPDTFDTFFKSNSKYNMVISKNFTLTLNSNNTYSYDNQTFFPINKQGWDTIKSNYWDYNRNTYRYKDVSGNYENFHFCMYARMSFTFRGDEIFNFRGDDDVWVYINNELAVDLGGLHSAEEENLSNQYMKNTLKLEIGKTYPLDFFYCERRTEASTLRMETNIEVFCPIYDYCGECNGDGSLCCKSKNACDDGNPCTIDTCPSPNTPGITKDNWKTFCTNTPIQCSSSYCSSTKCSLGSCNVTTPIDCPFRSCKVGVCSEANSGCQYNDLCVAQDKCYDNTCNPDGKSCTGNVKKNCDGGDKCMIYGCDPKTGCTSSKKSCTNTTDTNPCHRYYCDAATGDCQMEVLDASLCGCCVGKTINPCQYGRCNPSTGNCDLFNKTEIDDGNKCTIDKCDISNGNITNTPIYCNVSCQTCKNGDCVSDDTLCDDGNKCTIDKCGKDKCDFTPLSCDDNDPCTDDSCDPNKGCVNTPTVCPDSGSCSVGVCVKGVGCSTQPRNCTTGVFCTDAICIENVGCVNFTRKCIPKDTKCQTGTCNIDKQQCEFENYSPLPFGCNKAAIISTGVIAGIVVAAAVAVGIAAFAGKKGYDYWKNQQGKGMSNVNNNPLYTENPTNKDNPLYTEGNQ